MKGFLCLSLAILVVNASSKENVMENVINGMKELAASSREGGSVSTIPCFICMGSVEFLKDLVNFEENFTKKWVHDKMIKLCEIVETINEDIGYKCKEVSTKKLAEMVYGVIAKHMATKTLCTLAGQMTEAVSPDGSVKIDCKASRLMHHQDHNAPSLEEFKQGVAGIKSKLKMNTLIQDVV